LKHEIGGEPVPIPRNLLVKSLGRGAIELRQVNIKHDLLPANKKNRSFDAIQGNNSGYTFSHDGVERIGGLVSVSRKPALDSESCARCNHYADPLLYSHGSERWTRNLYAGTVSDRAKRVPSRDAREVDLRACLVSVSWRASLGDS